MGSVSVRCIRRERRDGWGRKGGEWRALRSLVTGEGEDARKPWWGSTTGCCKYRFQDMPVA
jgi:hypothetical protein